MLTDVEDIFFIIEKKNLFFEGWFGADALRVFIKYVTIFIFLGGFENLQQEMQKKNLIFIQKLTGGSKI